MMSTEPTSQSDQSSLGGPFSPTPPGDTILLVDLSSIAYPVYMMSTSEPDPNAASTKIVARVRSLASSFPHAAICVDKGKSFRAEIDPTYKAQRPEADAILHHQIGLAIETLRNDGFPIWAVKGYEADDLAATACARAMEREGLNVIIATADKDLLQLISPRVKAKSIKDGSLADEDTVAVKFGVLPFQMRDYLSLVGDSSDNIKGAAGIGPKRAAEMLSKHGSLDAIYQAMDHKAVSFSTAIYTSLQEFRPRMEKVRSLVTMRTDAPINFEEVLLDRVPKDVDLFAFAEEGSMEGPEDIIEVTPEAATSEPKPEPKPEPTTNGNGTHETTTTAIAVVPVEWERELDPRSYKDLRTLSLDLHQSRLFSAYGTPQAVLSAVMTGRELGLPAMSSLRCINVIEGKMALSAALMVALVLKSGFAEYFRPVSFDNKQATFETLRKGNGNKPVVLQHTIEMAMVAGLVKDKSNWLKIPIDMLVSRAQSRLARMVFPDLLAGLYTPEELMEVREAA